MKRRKIIGAMVRLKHDIECRGGRVFKQGEVLEITGSYYGYALQDPNDKCRYITRVNPYAVEFIDEEK